MTKPDLPEKLTKEYIQLVCEKNGTAAIAENFNDLIDYVAALKQELNELKACNPWFCSHDHLVLNCLGCAIKSMKPKSDSECEHDRFKLTYMYEKCRKCGEVFDLIEEESRSEEDKPQESPKVGDDPLAYAAGGGNHTTTEGTVPKDKPDSGEHVRKQELLTELAELNTENGDVETQHLLADKALLRYINDPEITEAFNEIEKWYA